MDTKKKFIRFQQPLFHLRCPIKQFEPLAEEVVESRYTIKRRWASGLFWPITTLFDEMHVSKVAQITYVDFAVVLPCKIFVFAGLTLLGLIFVSAEMAANCCVTYLEDKAGQDDHDQNGDISHPTQEEFHHHHPYDGGLKSKIFN